MQRCARELQKCIPRGLVLHALLMEVEENLSAQTLSSTRQARLKTIGDGCRNVLEELQSLVNKYESLGTQSKRT